MNAAVQFLTGTFPFSPEFQNVAMAFQGAVMVRNGANKNRNLHWFHAFMLSVVTGYAGGILNFIWLAKPSSFFANDLAMGSCIIAFLFVNYLPMNIGFLICRTFPFSILIVSGAQLFRSIGLVKFATVAFVTFKDNPSSYYPIPVFGPIMYATLLGNMGGFFSKGFEQHVGNGVPWPFQNGVFCATFYLFYAKDKDGPIGNFLRSSVPLASILGLDDETFACAFVSLFMQVMGILQMPEFFGPSFTPFQPAFFRLTGSVEKVETTIAKKQPTATLALAAAPQNSKERDLSVKPSAVVHTKETEDAQGNSSAKRKKRKKKASGVKEKEL